LQRALRDVNLSLMPVVRAAGGLLWRAARPGNGKGGVRLAVIHRPHRKDWSLPKGKLDDGETWEACAIREVREETGCEGRIATFAGAMSYVPRNNPKIVLYWHMELTREGKLEAKFRDEIDEVAWLTPEEALARLDYAGERRIVQRFPEGLAPPAPVPDSGERDAALSADLVTLRADLLRRVTALRSDDQGSGLVPALDLVGAAEDAAAAGRTDEARRLVVSARRMSLLSLQEPERSLRARLLLEEASELAPASRRAIRKLLAGEKISPEAIYLAAEVRDEARATTPPRDAGEPPEAADVGEATESSEAAEIREPGEIGEPSETSEVDEASDPSPVVRKKLPGGALGALAGLALLGLGVLLLLGARGASLAGTLLTSAVVGGAAGFLASRNVRS
jgi:8-oxo-dGTP pyrophosphatase MutT (NUDIX family)